MPKKDGGDDYRNELEQAKTASVGQLLFKAARLFNEAAVRRVQETTDMGFRVAHTTLFPHIDLEGTRLTDLAKRVGITKQAVGQLVGDLEAEGILAREPDPNDGRAKLVVFTEKGRNALLQGLTVLGAMEKELAANIGDALVKDLHNGLTALVEAFETNQFETRQKR